MNHSVIAVTSAAILGLTVAACSSNNKPTGSPASSAANSTTPTTTTTPPMAASRLGSILLTTQEAETIMGIPGIEPGKVYAHTMDIGLTGGTVSNPDCLGALYNVQEPVYAGSGYTAADTQIMGKKNTGKYVEQSAVVFSSAAQASAFAAMSADKWSSCAGQRVTHTKSGKTETLTFSQATRGQSRIAISNTDQTGFTCQHALRAVSNVIIEAQACGEPSPDEANRIVDQIAAKVTQ